MFSGPHIWCFVQQSLFSEVVLTTSNKMLL